MSSLLIRAGFSIENVQPMLSDDYSEPLTQTRYLRIQMKIQISPFQKRKSKHK